LIKISTPGRICLFGEHQDYLGLPVVAAAISKRVSVAIKPHDGTVITLDLPDIGQIDSIDLAQNIEYQHGRDYFRSAIKVLQRQGYTFSKGFAAKVVGNIPINSGTSSSSALLVAWVHTLMVQSDQATVLSTKEIAEIAYMAEVQEFDEAGGMMDQYATAMGQVIYLQSVPKIDVEFLSPKFGSFVLGDSGQPKDTQRILAWVKYGMLEIISKIKTFHDGFDLHTIPINALKEYKNLLSEDEYALLYGNVEDRDILQEGLALLRQTDIDHLAFGTLLNRHQNNLRDAKKISTSKIDGMISAALEAGALGAKINGSGGGGCMFAYAPENPQKVADAIEKAGGKAYIITIDKGSILELDQNFPK
jgi:galactokinase